MNSPFRIKKSYRIRHKILKFLYHQWDKSDSKDMLIGSIKIASETGIPIEEINKRFGGLVEKGEITASDDDGHIKMLIQQAGRDAFNDNRYITEGRKEYWEGIWNWARILIPLATLCFSIFVWIENNKLKSRIEQIEKTLQFNKIK